MVHFNNISAVQTLGTASALKPRGGDVRELTLIELIRELRHKSGVIPKPAVAAELYGRLVRTFSVPFLPLLAIPLGMAAKRGRRAPGLILAGVLLIGFHHGVQMAQSLAQTGRVDPALAIWPVYFVFIGICTWLFLASLKRPGDTPITRAVGHIATFVHWLRGLFSAPEAEPASVPS